MYKRHHITAAWVALATSARGPYRSCLLRVFALALAMLADISLNLGVGVSELTPTPAPKGNLRPAPTLMLVSSDEVAKRLTLRSPAASKVMLLGPRLKEPPLDQAKDLRCVGYVLGEMRLGL